MPHIEWVAPIHSDSLGPSYLGIITCHTFAVSVHWARKNSRMALRPHVKLSIACICISVTCWCLPPAGVFTYIHLHNEYMHNAHEACSHPKQISIFLHVHADAWYANSNQFRVCIFGHNIHTYTHTNTQFVPHSSESFDMAVRACVRFVRL